MGNSPRRIREKLCVFLEIINISTENCRRKYMLFNLQNLDENIRLHCGADIEVRVSQKNQFFHSKK